MVLILIIIKQRALREWNQFASANAVKRQICDLSHKIGITLQPIFVSRKMEQDCKPGEINPPTINQQCIVYSFTCDLCDSDYVT